MNLTGKQRQMLRAQAHSLNPVVQVGHAGLSDTVIAQIDEALTAHELIKIKLGKESPVAVEPAATESAERTRAAVIQCLGRVITLFRRNQVKPKVVLSSKDKDHTERTARSKASGRQLEGSARRKRSAAREASVRRAKKAAKKANHARARSAHKKREAAR